ncbi:transcription factor SKN7-like [Photinus pyralis]|uniref:transcription factor SKN7-like n=1 Tax=Photinus pyralis TaxID=7054 RepID=UPI0012677CF3|nr:transcription factor SKN7-like [Photinus pyralis]
MKWFYLFVAILLNVNAENENKVVKRSLVHLLNGPAIISHQLPQFHHWLQNDIAPSYFVSPFYGLSLVHHRPEIFGENLYTPDCTLPVAYPANLRITPSVPQAVAPKPQAVAPNLQTQNSFTYNAAQSRPSSPPQQPLLSPPPIPAPLPPPSRIGRLGSGSLGYVHLGNGLFALGSGSLGYTPPASTPTQPRFNYGNLRPKTAQF